MRMFKVNKLLLKEEGENLKHLRTRFSCKTGKNYGKGEENNKEVFDIKNLITKIKNKITKISQQLKIKLMKR